jgi:adenylate cyclase
MSDFRMDLKVEVIGINNDGTFTFKFIPDPNRYSLKTVNGVEGYWDKFDELFLPLDEFVKMIKTMKNCPIYDPKKTVTDITTYTQERIEYLNLNFGKNQESYQFYDKSEEFLDSLKKDKLRFVILSIDIVGSTKMSQELSIEDNSKIIQLFSSEISQLINGFSGYVLKYVGDGIIAYFPEPNYIGMIDNAIDCALSMKYFIINGLNTILNNKGLPSIKFRIGLDSGEAMVLTIGSKISKNHKDLIGKTINLTTKIQGLADPNQILAGEATIRNAHYNYRMLFDKMELPDTWSYSNEESNAKYSVFCFKF